MANKIIYFLAEPVATAPELADIAGADKSMVLTIVDGAVTTATFT